MRISDWSSDVCSSDLLGDVALAIFQAAEARLDQSVHRRLVPPVHRDDRQPHLAVHEIGYRARLQYVFALLRQEAVRRGHHELGRASCRERVGQYVSIPVVAVSLKTKT